MRSDEHPVAHAVRTRVRRAGGVGTDAPGRPRGEFGGDRVVGVHHEHVVGALVREHPRLCGRVRLDRPVPVDVVLGDVEEHRDVRNERVGGELELERRDLGYDDFGVLRRRGDDGRPDVPDRRSAEPPGRAHLRDHGGDGGLSIRAGHRDEARRRHERAEPLDRDVDL
jgi:hypothetical protein